MNLPLVHFEIKLLLFNVSKYSILAPYNAVKTLLLKFFAPETERLPDELLKIQLDTSKSKSVQLTLEFLKGNPKLLKEQYLNILIVSLCPFNQRNPKVDSRLLVI